jgi:hypothetical protein
VECKPRCINFKRVSDSRRAFQLAFGVTGISDDWYRTTMGVIVISLETPLSAGENIGYAWAHLGAPATSLEALTTRLGAPIGKLGSTNNKPESAEKKLGSAADKSGSTSNHSRAVWGKQYLLSEHCHRQKCKSTIGCATRTHAHAQLIASFPWTPAPRTAYSHV